MTEDESLRGEFEKHFICEDGTSIAASYPEQVCYKNDEGEWVDIDNSLSENSGRIENQNQDLSVSFAKNADDKEMVKLDNGDIGISWNLKYAKSEAETEKKTVVSSSIGSFFKKLFKIEEEAQHDDDMEMIIDNEIDANGSVIEFENTNKDVSDSLTENEKFMSAENIESNVVYSNVFSDTVDASYTVLPGRIKENIILNEKTDITSYSMNVICESLTATVTQDNSVEFTDVDGNIQYIIQTPYMFDEIYELSYNIRIEVTEADDGFKVTFYPDLNWHNSDDRIYPITIDPSVRSDTVKSNYSDTYIYQGSTASSSRALEERLRVGIYDGKKYKALWKANSLPSLSNNAIINSAEFNLRLPSVTTTSRPFSVYRINSSWESNTVTWAQSGEMTYTLLQSNVARNTQGNSVVFNVKETVKGWYNGSANNGFIFRYTDESFTNPDYNVFYSSDNTTSTAYMPYLYINYDNVLKKTYTNEHQRTANASYNRNAAASYAYQYGDYNSTTEYDTPNYYSTANSYGSGNGFNCTNFVSQCLHAGGMIYLGTSSTRTEDSTWRYDTLAWKYYASYTWGGADNFARHWGHDDIGTGMQRAYMTIVYANARYALAEWSYIKSVMNNGDVIQLADSSGIYHTMILYNYSNENYDMYYAQHTKNLINQSLKELLQKHENDAHIKIIFHIMK